MDMSNYQGSTRSSPTRRHINDNPLLDWNHQRNEVTQHICYAFHISINNSVEFFWRNIPNLVIFINSTCIVYWIYIQVSSMGKAVSHYVGLKVKKKKRTESILSNCCTSNHISTSKCPRTFKKMSFHNQNRHMMFWINIQAYSEGKIKLRTNHHIDAYTGKSQVHSKSKTCPHHPELINC